jgi:hypothetical protein
MQATTAKPAKPPRIREPKPEQQTPPQLQTSELSITDHAVLPAEPPPEVSVPELDAINASRHAVRQPPASAASLGISKLMNVNFERLRNQPLNADPRDLDRVPQQIGIVCTAINAPSNQLSNAEKSELLMNLRNLYFAAELAGKVPELAKKTCRLTLLGAQYQSATEQGIRNFLADRQGQLIELANLTDAREFRRNAAGLVAQTRTQPAGEQPALLIHLAQHLREIADARPEMKVAVASVMADKFNVTDQTKLSFLAPADRQSLHAIVAPFLVQATTFSHEKILEDITRVFGPTEEIKGEPAPSSLAAKLAKSLAPSDLGVHFIEKIDAALLPPGQKIHLYGALLRGMEALRERKGLKCADLLDAYVRMDEALISVGPHAANDMALQDALRSSLRTNVTWGLSEKQGLA